MKQVVFHSLFDRGDLNPLKHALLYFGKLRILKTSWLYLFDDDPRSCRMIAMPPEHAHEEVEHLAQQGLVEFVREKISAQFLHGVIIDGMNEVGRALEYSAEDLLPIQRYVQLDPTTPVATDKFTQTAIMQAAVMLGSVPNGLPCVDNALLHDLILLGARRIPSLLNKPEILTPQQIDGLKANAVGQRALSVCLPSFELESFDAVLSLRESLKDPLKRFQHEVLDLSAEIDAPPWDPAFGEQVNSIVTNRILPGVKDLEKAARFAPWRVAKSMAAAGAIVWVQSLFPQVIADWVVGGGALAAADAIRREGERAAKAREDSAFSFLLQLRDRARQPGPDSSPSS